MFLADSAFANRLSTNYVPSDSETLEIRALLVDPEAQLARIDAQIKEMEIALGRLKEQRASLKQPIDAHRALISPIRRIPQDVLLEIFLSCLPSEHNAIIDPAEAPLVLGCICRHWRSVAYSTPMLWSSMHIPSLEYFRMPANMLSGLERAVEAWLDRSGTCPLSISIFDRFNYFSPSLEKHPIVLQLLQVSRRLRHLTLEGDVQLFRPLLRLGPEELPLLTAMWMHTTVNLLVDDHPDLTNALGIPTLEDVALIFAVTKPLALPLKWSEPTRLRFECFSVWTEHGSEGGLHLGGAFEVLRQCPNLVHCEIQVTKPTEDPDLTLIHASSIVLPHLHTLVLRGWPFHFEKWISHLALPNLVFLQVGETSLARPSRFVRDGNMTAELDPNRFTSSSLHELLQSFPMISHLRLSSVVPPPEPISLDNAFMELFCPPHELCPGLTHISIPTCAEFSDAAVLAFVKARMAMSTPLQEVRIQFNRPMEFDVMPELQSYISDGLQVTLEYPRTQWKFYPRAGLDGEGSFH
ncbi:hypothetical protein K438DRAFT_1802372 [Mycena galopus ATCC 62051]|nr:hypothetical protein K438DRAFT_1802372 [Mycena galopus ATCC 62051]